MISMLPLLTPCECDLQNSPFKVQECVAACLGGGAVNKEQEIWCWLHFFSASISNKLGSNLT